MEVEAETLQDLSGQHFFCGPYLSTSISNRNTSTTLSGYLYFCQCVSVSVDRAWLKDEGLKGIISMAVLRDASVVVGYDRRRSGLSSAPLDMEYGNNSIEY